MSRENFFIKVHTIDTDKVKGSEVLLHADHIVAIVNLDNKGSTVLTITGVVYTVREAAASIMEKLTKFNVGRELT